MNGIASLLDPAANLRVERIWQQLEARCGLSGVRVTPFPHITWQVSEGYHLPKLEETLQEISRNTNSFIIHTYGLGIFTGESPVIYISIFKDEHLMDLQSQLWEQIKGFSKNPDILYSPLRWIPHITLAYNDLNPANINCALQELAFESYNWEISIDNFIYISQVDDQTVESGRYQLGG